MRRHLTTATLAALLLHAGTAMAHDEHAGHMAVGKVAFANSCAPAVQAEFLSGVAMLHSFWYSAGEAAFRSVLAKDPSCAIAQWGIASLMMANPLAGVGATPKSAEIAQAAIAQARQTGAKTQRERDYIDAVGSYYRDWASHSERERQETRSKAYEALAAKYPADDEAQIFNALYIAGTQKQSDQTYAAYARSAAILEKQFAKYPNHPGVAHYLIHVYDAPPLAKTGLAAARRYSGLAPDAPHALHMPSHIFTRVGAWTDSAATNSRSFAAAIGGNEVPEAFHASDYMVYADLQLGRDVAARTAMEAALKYDQTPRPPTMAYAAAAMPARYVLERGDWAGAARLTPAGGKVAYTEALTWFARGLGAARSGDIATVEQSATGLATQHKVLADAGNTYWATEVEIQQRTIGAWIAFAKKDTDAALKSMREAADAEDRNEKHIVTPGRLLPARELLGDMLLEAGQPAAALKEYDASQQREPNRFRGYYGAARAMEALGDRVKAKAAYGKLLALAKNADAPRPEIQHAKAYVGG
jgi:tetratricopeptide (TPR) repeat protein